MRSQNLLGLYGLLSLAGIALAGDAIGVKRAAAPIPTAAPNMKDLQRALLRARAVTADEQYTCGFVSGEASHALTCDANERCVENTTISVFGCCGSSTVASNCVITSECWDSTGISALASASGLPGTSTLACSAAESPYCAGFVLNGLTAFFCNSVREYETAFVIATDANIPTTSAATMTSMAPSTQTTTVLPPTMTSASPTPAPSNGGGLSTGAIVGIAVACAAVGLGAITGIGCCFYIKHKNKDKNNGNHGNSGMVHGSGNVPPSGGHGPANVVSSSGGPVEMAQHGGGGAVNVNAVHHDPNRFSGGTAVSEGQMALLNNKLDDAMHSGPNSPYGFAHNNPNGEFEILSNDGHQTISDVQSHGGFRPPHNL